MLCPFVFSRLRKNLFCAFYEDITYIEIIYSSVPYDAIKTVYKIPMNCLHFKNSVSDPRQ